MIVIQAPAKINLTLEILGKRPDEYHEIRSVIQTIGLCDILTFEDDAKIRFNCNSPDWQAEKSLCSSAVSLLTRNTGYDGGANICLEKRIPISAGLGGDSSDAAVVLLGLNQLWKLRFTKRELAEMAIQLGSDVPYFIYGGTCLMEGRGEKITPLPAILHRWLVMVVPSLIKTPGKTKKAYDNVQSSHYTDGQISQKIIENIRSKTRFDDSLLFNTFENNSFAKGQELAVYRDHINKSGTPPIHLAGSGPTLFMLFEDRKLAEEVFIRLTNQGMETYLTETRPESLE